MMRYYSSRLYSFQLAWFPFVLLGFNSMAQLAVAQEAEAKVTADKPAEPSKISSEPATFTEQLRNRDAEDLQQKQQTQNSAAFRAKYYGALPEGTNPVLAQEYNSAFQKFRDSLALVREHYLRHHVAWDVTNDTERLRNFTKASFDSHNNLKAWTSQMAKVYATDPAKFGGIGNLMEEMVLKEAAADRFEAIAPLAKVLFDSDSKHSNELLEAIAYTGYAMNDFDLSWAALAKLSQQIKLPLKLQVILEETAGLKAKWERELKFREADAASNTNPRVLLFTNRGELEIELFEDQAPQAVANFIFLVERGFYKRKLFFRVVEHLGAQTGCDRGDGQGNAGYTIPGEMQREDHRDIFRGSLFFAVGSNEETKEPELDSASSQFLMSMMPQPHLDGKMTVFGRIISGEQWLGTLARMDLSDEKQKKDKSNKPDFVIDASVIRKRDHKYIPEISAGRLP
ncbi:MAG: peptidylprolyl isomerase [Planctomycetota bacterium]|nr:peptidylprolyl isomerase [Planctomycetota bacterium]